MSRLSRPLLCLALLLPSSALAGTAVVPPLVAKGVDPLVNLNLTSLVSSEADFLGEFDEVKQLDEAPSGLNASCLTSTSCLGGIARANGASAVIAGQAIPGGGEYEFKLVYYDAGRNRIIRSVSFKLPDSPAAIADGMGPNVKEVVTGQAQAKPETALLADAEDMDFLDDDFEAIDLGDSNSRRLATPQGSGRRLDDVGDDLEFLDADDEDAARAAAEDRRAEEAAAQRRADEEAAARAAAEADARRRAEDEARRRAEQEAAAKAAARRAEEQAQARRRAEEDAAQRAAEEAARAAAASQEEDDFDDFENFELSSSTTVVANNEAGEEERYTPPPSSSSDRSSGATARAPSRDSSSRSSRDDDLDDLDQQIASARDGSSRERASRDSSSSRSSSSRDSDRSSSSRNSASVNRDSDDDKTVLLAARVGFAPYQGLGFVTYGAEVQYIAVAGLGLVGGVEGYSVQRTIPAEQLEPGEEAKQWNTILPINLGLQYHIGQGSVRPYLGADFLIIPGYVQKTQDVDTGEVSGGGTAMGGRGRLGANFLLMDSFALNLNGGVGFIGGADMQSVAAGMKNGALLAQVSGGTVLYF